MTHYETIRLRKDGTQIPISLTVSPIYDDAGVVVGASKIARDITERSRLEAAAADHAAITRKLAEVGAMVASTLDRDAIVQKVTDTARELTHAEFGAFFYNVHDAASGDTYMHNVVGAPSKRSPGFRARATRSSGPRFAARDGQAGRRDAGSSIRQERPAFRDARRSPAGAVTLPSRSRACRETCSAGCSSATRRWACSRRSTSGWSRAWRRGRRWR